MTNDNTNYRKKANAVLFAAVMVVSMFAAGFAAAPAAAAQPSNVSVDNLDPNTAVKNDVVTHDLEISADSVTVGDGNGTATFDVQLEGGSFGTPTGSDVVLSDGTNTVNEGNTSVTVTGGGSNLTVDYDTTAGSGTDLSGDTEVTLTATVDVTHGSADDYNVTTTVSDTDGSSTP